MTQRASDLARAVSDIQVSEPPENLPPSLRLALIARLCAPSVEYGLVDLVLTDLSVGELVRRMETVLWFASDGHNGHDWGYR